jgi:hypothetical protein
MVRYEESKTEFMREVVILDSDLALRVYRAGKRDVKRNIKFRKSNFNEYRHCMDVCGYSEIDSSECRR